MQKYEQLLMVKSFIDAVYVFRFLTFWPRKRLLVERTVKLSARDPSVVLSADADLLTSPLCNNMNNI